MQKRFDLSKALDHASKITEAYHVMLKPLCKECDLPPLALDVLLFLANNPNNATANSMCRMRGVKSGIVSVHIDRLVQAGLLERTVVPEDRRKTRLTPTEKARDLIEKGQKIQCEFAEELHKGISPEDEEAWQRVMKTIDGNISDIIEKKGGKYE